MLAQVRRLYPKKTVSVSLSTLGAENESAGKEPSNNTSYTLTNRIQKEILKQLLYREKPSVMRNSRFRRITRFNPLKECITSGLIAAVAVTIVFLTRIADRFINLFGTEHPKRSIAYGLLLLGCFIVTFAVRYAFHNRLWIEKIGAGPATIALSNRSGSFFDEYLDEIVYFFEATETTIAIFEDLDRFDEPQIFESLRELNTILNNSKSLEKNPIRFIYALRDSIFEQLGTVMHSDYRKHQDAADVELARTNRTKFFDLVIPIVPFITHRSSRDLMSSTMGTDTGIDFDLIDTAARHITDMRLIKNIHNEFVVFKQRLLTEDSRLSGLTPTALFALILYKNIHLSDFEHIRTGDSDLDDIYRKSRRLVENNIADLNSELARLRSADYESSLISKRSERLGEQLEEYIRRVIRHIEQSSPATFRVSIAGHEFALPDLRTDQFWQKFLEEGGSNALVVTSAYIQQAVFKVEDLAAALRADLSLSKWAAGDRRELRNRIEKANHKKQALRRSNWQQLYADDAYTEDPGLGAESPTFKEIVAFHAKSELAVDLIANGYLDANFALYVSQYYGFRVTLQAMNFILHHIEPDVMDAHFELAPGDVDALLRECAPSTFTEKCMYNVSILDRLLGTGDGRADKIISSLARLGAEEQAFIAAYIADGSEGEKLFRKLSWNTEKVFTLIRDAEVDETTRLSLYSAALEGGDDTMSYEGAAENTDRPIADYLAANYDRISALTSDLEKRVATSVVKILTTLGVVFEDISALGLTVRQAVVDAHIYRLTLDNLRNALEGSDELALDSLVAQNSSVYEFVLDNLQDYLGLLFTTRRETVQHRDAFLRVIADVTTADPATVENVAKRASVECVIESLSDITKDAWSGLFAARRVHMSLNNVYTYVSEFGIDRAIATSLTDLREIEQCEDVDESVLTEVAIQLLNAPAEILSAGTRVRLAHSLNLQRYLQVDRITPSSDTFVGLLFQNKLVADEEESFKLTADLSWPEREFAITQSPAFRSYFTAALVPEADLVRLFESQLVPEDVKARAFQLLLTYSDTVSAATADAAAAFAEDTSIDVDSVMLTFLLDRGGSQNSILKLLPRAIDSLSDPDLMQILGRLGPPYSQIESETGGPVDLPLDDSSSAIARRLRKAEPPWQTRTLTVRNVIRLTRPR
ncbi:hypothetical protein hbim_00805 [Mycolicibacterium mageritense]|uniref:YobI-like P-loop NTPase domain-containing protein n=1 Tax=Mycolicibacterium mageritense TaxID=53462 RepID=A0AAI8TQJ6_MYCME|nr:hypothetical protein hbim_00805 [Mycolicibacterium mageritense]